MIDEKKIPQRLYIIDYQLLPCEIDGVADARINAMPFKTQKGRLCEYINLEALWHDASEIPEKGKAFIFLAESNSSKHYHVGVVYNPMDYDKNCEWWGVIEWCYIEDLLPKGGEK